MDDTRAIQSVHSNPYRAFRVNPNASIEVSSVTCSMFQQCGMAIGWENLSGGGDKIGALCVPRLLFVNSHWASRAAISLAQCLNANHFPSNVPIILAPFLLNNVSIDHCLDSGTKTFTADSRDNEVHALLEL